MSTGRPSKFTPELIDKILFEISEGNSERSIFEANDMPSFQAWTKFKFSAAENSDESFLAQYALAKESKYEVWEHKIVKRSLDESRDYYVDSKGERKSDNTAVQRDRLITDNMKWIMCKLFPKKYGEKVQQEVTGKDGAPFQPVLNITIKKDSE